MDVSRWLLVGVVYVGLAVPVVQAQDEEDGVAALATRAPAPAKPWRNVRGFGRVLDLSRLPVVIDEPGIYAIDRNWRIPAEAVGDNPELIRITADDVTLDLHGFEITAREGQGATLLVITGSAEIRNGGLDACCEAFRSLHVTGFARLHHLSILSFEAMTFEGPVALTDSDVSVRTTCDSRMTRGWSVTPSAVIAAFA